jgi:predicted RNase H-like HicB family nuclease
MESCNICPVKWAYNEFFEGQKAVFSRSRWQEQSDIIFQATSGISPIAATNGDFSSNSQGIGTAICRGCIKPGSGMVYRYWMTGWEWGILYQEDEPMKIEIEREDDGRWIAEVPDLAGVMVYGKTREEAIAKVQSLALRVIADRLDHGEGIPELDELFAVPT